MIQRIDISDSRNVEIETINDQTHITITEKIIIDKFNFEQRFRAVAKLKNLTIYEVSKRLEKSQANLYVRIGTGKFTFEEQRAIAKALDCNIVIKTVFDDGATFYGDTKKQLVSDSCAHAGLTITDLAGILGVSRQSFFGKLDRGRFTDAELADIVKKIGCNYMNYFELEGGIKI